MTSLSFHKSFLKSLSPRPARFSAERGIHKENLLPATCSFGAPQRVLSDLLLKIEAIPTFDNVPDYRRSHAANRQGERRQAMFSLAAGCVQASSHYKPRLEGLSF
jgi:hypothetical protein